MNAVLDLLTSRGWTNLVWTLLHSLWLGVVWGLALWLFLRLCGNDPEKRYRSALGALGGLILSILVTWAVMGVDPAPNTEAAVNAPSVSQASGIAPVDTAARADTVPAPPLRINWISRCGVVWAAGCICMLLRLVSQVLASGRVRRASDVVREGPLFELLRELQSKIGCDRIVTLATNGMVLVPSVAGVLSPTILLPASLLSGIPPEQLRAVLLHELAHIRRHDYLVNLLQQVLEALLFFNPAVWWINRQIRLEREACCDRIAAASCSHDIYAAALVQFAERVHAAQSSLQPAFPGDRQPSSLLERMRRIMVAGYQPAVRLPWHGTLAMLVATGLLLFCAWRGTRFAVTLAAEILSPEKRIEKIAELKRNIGPVPANYDDHRKLNIAGVVRTEDGGPLPEHTGVTLVVANAQRSGAYGIGLKNGRFQHLTEYGDVTAYAWAPSGYGPAIAGPFRPEPGASLTNLELVLPSGFASKIRVTDSEGKPIEGVELEGNYQAQSSFFPLKLRTDTEGMAIVEHAVDFPMHWKAQREGFQTELQNNVRMASDTPLLWTLKPARATTGVVVSETTGAPIPEAALKLLYRSDQPGSGQLASAPVLAESNAQGQFRLDSLAETVRYEIAVEAKGYATTFLHGLRAGESGLRVELGPELHVAGTITGDLSRLVGGANPVLAVAQRIQLQSHGSEEFHHVPVEITQGVGTFAISNLWKGELVLDAGGKQFRYFLSDAKTNLTLELPAKDHGPARRTVIVRFQPPQGLPPVRGHLEVQRAFETDGYRREFVPIEKNEARLEALAGTFLSWTPAGIIGYWTPEGRENIEEGSQPKVFEVPVLPAGAIYGNLKNADGSGASGFTISVIETKAAPDKTPGNLGEVGKNSATSGEASTRFVAQPLPLGGEYLIIAWRGKQLAASELLSLTEKEPIRQIELEFPEGETLSGSVVDAENRPLAGIPIALGYETPYGHGYGILSSENNTAPLTDSEGRFAILHLNPDLPGHYTVSLNTPGYQPIARPATIGEPLTLVLARGETLKGTLINDSTGKPLEGATLTAMALNPVPRSVQNLVTAGQPSDAQGRFEFNTLARGEYNLYCRDGEIVSTVRIQIPRESKMPLVVRLKPYPTARVWENGEPVAAEK